jgi:hypothetical protein
MDCWKKIYSEGPIITYRMELLDRFLPFRKRASFITPCVLFILVAVMQFAPFAAFDEQTVVSNEVTAESDLSFHPDHVVAEEYESDLAETFAPFGGKTTETIPYTSYSFIDDIEDVADDVGDRLGTITTLILLMAIIGFTSRGRELEAHPNITRRSISGATMALLAVLFFLLAKDIQGGFGDSIDSTLESFYDDPDEDVVSINEGAWGKIVMEPSETTVFTVDWGPSWMYWLAVFGMLVAAVGAFAGLSTLSPKLDTEELPVWPDDLVPDWLTTDRTHVWFGAIALAIVLAMVAPWYSVDQTWVKSENVGEVYTNSTHELGWTMSPFYVHFSNDTGLFLAEGGEEEGDLSGYTEKFELGNMAPILLELRWPLIMMGVLLGGWGISRWVPEARKRLELDETQLGFVFTVALVFVMSFSATADFEKAMTRTAEDDLRTLSPLLNNTFVHLGAEDLFAGESFNTDFDFDGNAFITSYAHMEWGPSWGFWASSILSWLCFGLICSIGVPRAIDRLNQEEPTKPMFDRDLWAAKPVVATLVGVLLISGLGSFPPSALGDGSSSAPQALYQWNLFYDRPSQSMMDSGTLEADQTVQYAFDTEALGIENATGFSYYLVCYEGETSILSDSPDSVRFTISPPGGVDTQAMETSGTLACNGGYISDFSNGDVYLPMDEYAPNNQTFLDLIRFFNPHNGVWTFRLTADVQGSDAFSSDGSLDFELQLYGEGYRGFTAEKREE